MTVFIQLGDAPLSVRQAKKRGLKIFNGQLAQHEREAGILMQEEGYLTWAAEWLADNVTNGENNTFNHQLAAYRKAVERLARYRVADGQPEIIEDQPTGETDPETGEPITAPVVVQRAIDPLPAEVDGWDNTDPENPVATLVPNPLIERDNAALTIAIATIAATPAAIVEFEVANA
jgi:hypothetical protein